MKKRAQAKLLKAEEKAQQKRAKLDPDSRNGILKYLAAGKADERAARGRASQQDSQARLLHQNLFLRITVLYQNIPGNLLVSGLPDFNPFKSLSQACLLSVKLGASPQNERQPFCR